jgi:two-component system NtrC family sensor kinase
MEASKMQLFRSLKARLLVFVFAAAFIPLIMVTFTSLRYAEQITKSILYTHLHSITQNKARAIARWLSERITDVRVIADSRALRSMDSHEIDSYLESMKAHYLDYRRIVLVDPRGEVVADTADRRENYRDMDWFQEAIEHGGYMSDAFWEDDRLVFLIAVAVVEDVPVGVLCEFIDLEYLSNFASDMALGKSGESYLVNRDGMIIAHKDRQRVLKDRVANFDLLMQLSESGTGLEVYQNYRGAQVMGAQTWIPQQTADEFRPVQWMLIAEQDTDEVFAKVNRYRMGIIALFLLLSCVIATACVLISRTIVQPIKELADATVAVAGGNFDKQLKVDGRDELGRLTVAFNQMAQQLRSYYTSLENRIASTREELEKVSGELQKSKEVLARSEKLVALGQVSAGMAHEIRTPLTSIKLFFQSLENTLPSDDETLEDFSIIKGEIDRMEEIINRFLSFARPVEPKFESVNINQILSDAISLIKTRIEGGKIAIETEYDNNLTIIAGDKRQLGQVFMNMLLNSIEAMPEGGKITVATNVITVSDEYRKLLRITIADTGCGIDDASERYIFDPFFTTKDSGTGMGLAIAFTVIEQHGGLIEVESEPSKGTTFMIYLPLSWGDANG